MKLILARLANFLALTTGHNDVVIYGSGELGTAFFKFIRERFTDINIVGFVESKVPSSGTQSLQRACNTPIYGVSELKSLTFNRILISSFRYQDDIASTLTNSGVVTKDIRIFIPDGDLDGLEAKITQLLLKRDLEGMQQLVFQHPEKKHVWRAYSQLLESQKLPVTRSIYDVVDSLSL